MNVNRITSRLIVSLSLGASALSVVPSHATATISSVPTNPFALSLPQPKAAWVLDRIPCGAKICVRLLTSKNQGSTWATQHLPSAMVGSLTFVGSTGWLIIGNDRGVTGAARLASSGDWVAMNAPCATVGNSFAVPVPLFGSAAVALCTIGGFGSNVDAGTPPSLALGTNWLFSSTDGGGIFHPLRVFGRSQQNQVVGASAAYGPYAASLFSTRSVNHATGVILQRSTSLGARWLTVASASSTALTPQFTSLRVAQNFGGVIVQTSPTHTTLWLTHDTGQHWSSTLR